MGVTGGHAPSTLASAIQALCETTAGLTESSETFTTTTLGITGGPVIVVSNRIPVADGQEEPFAARFRARAGLVEGHSGFVRLEILKPTEVAMHGRSMGRSAYHVALTYWERVEDFVRWTDSA
ncbi:MAG TPA: antibiotic biosynthesis monooxygenase, partial [Nitrospirales bacterium]|nr:antibiotic biosynthesis monooxygenase [Nitrospirales bacterium]